MKADCKNCVYVKKYTSPMVLAMGGITYLCTKHPNIGENGVVGHYDFIAHKESWKEYGIKECSDFKRKEPKEIIWKKRKEELYSFRLENDEYYVHGGDHTTSQMVDKTWCIIKRKKDNYGGTIYLDANYVGTITEELEDEIIKNIKEKLL